MRTVAHRPSGSNSATVRHTSRAGPDWTDGVPIACVAAG